MKAFETKDKKVMVYLYEKNDTYIKWLEYFLNNFGNKMSASNYGRAQKQVKNLKKQNKDILEALGDE